MSNPHGWSKNPSITKYIKPLRHTQRHSLGIDSQKQGISNLTETGKFKDLGEIQGGKITSLEVGGRERRGLDVGEIEGKRAGDERGSG